MPIHIHIHIHVHIIICIDTSQWLNDQTLTRMNRFEYCARWQTLVFALVLDRRFAWTLLTPENFRLRCLEKLVVHMGWVGRNNIQVSC